MTRNVFVPSRGFLFFYGAEKPVAEDVVSFRPLTGISLFLWAFISPPHGREQVFVPSRGFLFFYKQNPGGNAGAATVFVPSRGFLFFYIAENVRGLRPYLFSSPHGDFSFSILSHIPLINQGLFL